MWYSMKELEDIVISAPGNDLDVLRFCLSDKISLSIDSVVLSNLSPVEYAFRMIKKHYKELYENFYKGRIASFKIPEPFIKAFMFDNLTSIASYLRVTALGPNPIEYSSSLIVNVNPSLLITTAPYIPYINYGGFAEYKYIVNNFIDYNKLEFKTGQIPLLKKFADSVSNIEDPNWIFHHPLWQKACLNKQTRLIAMRKFLYVTIISYIIPDNHLASIFGVERKIVFRFMEEFLDLRESPETKISDITEFIYSLSTHFIDVSRNLLHIHILHSAFSDLSAFEKNPLNSG